MLIKAEPLNNLVQPSSKKVELTKRPSGGRPSGSIQFGWTRQSRCRDAAFYVGMLKEDLLRPTKNLNCLTQTARF
ncbi:MAG: hypothetical protein Ct9H300mP21_10250 [Pseudomonadota bacterium]|nr:MAG: hypothetical protein Ct9H300mP21_10250 [Pseudomonadota bacterium]